jgi:hypothetical protein
MNLIQKLIKDVVMIEEEIIQLEAQEEIIYFK